MAKERVVLGNREINDKPLPWERRGTITVTLSIIF